MWNTCNEYWRIGYLHDPHLWVVLLLFPLQLSILLHYWKKQCITLRFSWTPRHESVLGSGGIAPYILYLGTRCRWVVSFTPRTIYVIWSTKHGHVFQFSRFRSIWLKMNDRCVYVLELLSSKLFQQITIKPNFILKLQTKLQMTDKTLVNSHSITHCTLYTVHIQRNRHFVFTHEVIRSNSRKWSVPCQDKVRRRVGTVLMVYV
jgi:hypothetical protein